VHRRQILDYAAMALIWGFSFVLVLQVVGAFGWVGAVTLRSFTAAAILLVISIATGRVLRFGAWRPLAVVGATTVAGQLIGLSFATPRIGTAMAAIFVAGIPLFSGLIGALWGIERVTRSGRVGLLLGFSGVVMLVGFPAVPVTPEFVLGCGAQLFAVISAAFGTNYARRHLTRVGSWEQTMGAFFFGGLLTFPLLLVVPIPAMPRLVDVGSLIALAGLCSALAYVLYFRLVAEVGPTRAISVEFVVTVIAVTVGAVLLGERLSPVQLAGGAVIITGCLLTLGLLPVRRSVVEPVTS
jgi:drug/metabolite transporter (DMT)-like permease